MVNNGICDQIRIHLSRLVEGEISPEEASNWALSVMEQYTSESIDPKVWHALDQLAGADLLESPGNFLHDAKDFSKWYEDFSRSASVD